MGRGKESHPSPGHQGGVPEEAVTLRPEAGTESSKVGLGGGCSRQKEKPIRKKVVGSPRY